MAILNIGKKSDLNKITSLSVKEVLSFLEDGTISLEGESGCSIGKCCVCGGVAAYYDLAIRPISFMRCEYDLKFFCPECFEDGKKRNF